MDINTQVIEEAKIGVFLDIGCNIGHYLKQMAARAKHVHGFEPAPKSIRACYTAAHVTLHECALWKENCRLKLYTAHFDQMHTVNNRAAKEQWGRDPKRFMEVDARTLDSFNLTDVTCAKIDVEGAEIEVFLGGEETFRNNKMLIALETHQEVNLHHLITVLRSYNYRIWNEEGLEVQDLHFDRAYICSNE